MRLSLIENFANYMPMPAMVFIREDGLPILTKYQQIKLFLLQLPWIGKN